MEAALVFLPLMALMLALIDFSLALFLRATMQNAVREGVRYAVTYQTSGGMCQDASIKAVVNPAGVNYLYFVASPACDGTHLFAATLPEHNANVTKFHASPCAKGN